MKIIIHYVLILLFTFVNSALSESNIIICHMGNLGTLKVPQLEILTLNGHIRLLMKKKKIKISIPCDHVVPKNQVLENINKLKMRIIFLWIGHATFLIKLVDNMIITDPVVEKTWVH